MLLLLLLVGFLFVLKFLQPCSPLLDSLTFGDCVCLRVRLSVEQSIAETTFFRLLDCELGSILPPEWIHVEHWQFGVCLWRHRLRGCFGINLCLCPCHGRWFVELDLLFQIANPCHVFFVTSLVLRIAVEWLQFFVNPIVFRGGRFSDFHRLGRLPVRRHHVPDFCLRSGFHVLPENFVRENQTYLFQNICSACTCQGFVPPGFFGLWR